MLVASLVIGDFVVKPRVDRHIAERMQERYLLASTPSAELHGRPFLLHVARREIPKVTASLRDIDYLGVHVERADVDVRGVRFKWDELGSERWTSTIDGGTARVRITEQAFGDYLRGLGIDTNVTLRAGELRLSGAVSVLGFSGVVGASAEASVIDGSMRVTATNLELDGRSLSSVAASLVRGLLSFSLPLPRFFDSDVTELRLLEGAVEFTARLGPNALLSR